MRRRELVPLLGSLMAAARPLHAQQKAMPVIGYLGSRRAADYGPGLGGVLEAAGKISATELGKAHILRDRFAGQVAEVFQDIDVLLVPVWNTPMPSAAEWVEILHRDRHAVQRAAPEAAIQFVLRLPRLSHRAIREQRCVRLQRSVMRPSTAMISTW